MRLHGPHASTSTSIHQSINNSIKQVCPCYLLSWWVSPKLLRCVNCRPHEFRGKKLMNFYYMEHHINKLQWARSGNYARLSGYLNCHNENTKQLGLCLHPRTDDQTDCQELLRLLNGEPIYAPKTKVMSTPRHQNWKRRRLGWICLMQSRGGCKRGALDLLNVGRLKDRNCGKWPGKCAACQ